MKIFESKEAVLFDAAMGTALLAAGQPTGVGSEDMNLLAPETVERIHAENIHAGSDVITSNSFGVSQMMLRGETEHALQALRAAAGIAKRVAIGGGAEGRRIFACLDIGPTGFLLGPYGDRSYEEAEVAFAEQAKEGARVGVDFILLETFADIEEFIRAARAARSVSDLPVVGTMTFDANGRSYMGATPADLVREARAAGLLAVGANCSLGPAEMVPVIRKIMEAADGLPVIAQPNAGMPVCKNGRTVYEMSPEVFAVGAGELLDLGIAGIGGCCGTTPAMIAAVRGIMRA